MYTPETAGSGPLPVSVYYHGGGWVIADLDTYEASALAMAHKTGAIVVSAEYRHAPENRFPAAHEDAVASYKWVVENAGQFNGDAQRVAVMGESAGGNLAANVAIAARDQKLWGMAPVVKDAERAQALAAKDLKQAFSAESKTGSVQKAPQGDASFERREGPPGRRALSWPPRRPFKRRTTRGFTAPPACWRAAAPAACLEPDWPARWCCRRAARSSR